MIKLKNYQIKTLEILKEFLELSRFEGVNKAYEKIQAKRFQGNKFNPFNALPDLENIPYCCLRLPTGGGKTLLSAYTIKVAGESFIEKEFPLTLWLVPSNIIKEQTLETLKNPAHANYQVLADAFNGKFCVFDIADFQQIRPQDIANKACVIVSTFASLRVDKTEEGRKVYLHDENLEPHFSKIPSNANKMEVDENGKIRFSFANLLNWHRPLVIVDEAHNAKTENNKNEATLSLKVLQRINACLVIEYSATPADNSNVITSITAAELKAEEMIKLPIILTKHDSWEQAVIASIQTRQKLEELAQKDQNYIRPIILFQAENIGGEVTYEILKKYLIDSGISENQIAVATSSVKDLDDINLLSSNCEIRYVITVQALREGWDCSFAYVLCSVANTQSSTAIEQLLGRVLRMPYAQNRELPELNKAYAHVSSQSWDDATKKMHELLVRMGFQKEEAKTFTCEEIAPELDLQEPKAQPFTANLNFKPDFSSLDLLERELLKVEEKADGSFKINVLEGVDKKLIEKIISATENPEDQKEIIEKSRLKFSDSICKIYPAEKGEKFIIPQLCLDFGDGAELAETEAFLDHENFNLLDFPTNFNETDFRIYEELDQYCVDISAQKIVTISAISETEQLNLEGIKTILSEQDLCLWLNRRLKQQDVPYEIMLEFLRKVIKNLLAREDINMQKLELAKFALEKFLHDKISFYKKEAKKKCFQKYLFGVDSIACVNKAEFNFSFDAKNYPANSLYQGKYKFNKHYCALIAEMRDEEAECAFEIDKNPNVKFWIRNIERQPKYSFCLPTSTDKFYPDFVAKLNDGRILAIEYKGLQYKGGDDAEEKELIGKFWAEKSGNLFLMAWKDKNSKNLKQQIEEVIC